MLNSPRFKRDILNSWDNPFFCLMVKKGETLKNQRFSHFYKVLVAGLEPARCCHRGILSPLRLPIPPHQLTLQNDIMKLL